MAFAQTGMRNRQCSPPSPPLPRSFISLGSTRLIDGNATSIASSTTVATTNGVTPRKIVARRDAAAACS